MTQPPLFQHARHCPACPAQSNAEGRAPRCEWDGRRRAGEPPWQLGGRPRGCLNAYDPATAEIPY